MQHPNLFFSAFDVSRFRERIKIEEKARALYEKAVENVEKVLAEDFVTEAQANGRNTQSQHADFGSLNRQANSFCYVLGVKYLIDGDERCAEKMKGLLYHLIGFERWFGVSYTVRKPVPWHADLCSTSTTVATARIYDIIFDYLTENERRELAAGLLERGVYAALSDWALPETRIHALDSMGHNWWAVCIAEAATAFLALSDYLPEAEKKRVLDCVDEALAEYMTYPGNPLFNKFGNFDDKGFFYESIGYNNFGTGSLMRYLWCRERYDGRNERIRRAIPEGLCDAVMKMAYPLTRDGKTDYEFMQFGDHSPGKRFDYPAKYCILLGIDSSALRCAAANWGSDIWDAMIGYEPEKLKGSFEYLPKTELYSSGFAVARKNWEPDGTMLAVKSGFCWNHSHNDAGSFVIWHKGKAIFTDSGTCDYDLPLYHDFYCQDRAHSVITVGGKGRRDEELYRGTKFRGSLTDSFTSDDLFFVQADSAGPMAHLCSRLFRNFLWFDSRLLVIVDDIYCHTEETAQFTLHFDADYEEKNGEVLFTNGDCRARFIAHYPEDMRLTEAIGHADHQENEDKIYLVSGTEKAERTHLLIHTVELDPDEHDVRYTSLSGENCEGVRFTGDGLERDVWFNRMADGHVMHDNSNNVIGGYETDAYILVVTRDKARGTEKVLMICGSYLRKDGKVYISSFAKQTKEVVTEC